VAKAPAMATARAAAARKNARPKPRAPTRPRGARRQPQGIRWDRVARTMLLVVLLGVVVSFLGPATKYVRTWQLARETRSEVQQLRTGNALLRREATTLKDPAQVQLRARRLGMARPGERVYVVRGLPKGR
jgi:cell division protein FtsB